MRTETLLLDVRVDLFLVSCISAVLPVGIGYHGHALWISASFLLNYSGSSLRSLEHVRDWMVVCSARFVSEFRLVVAFFVGAFQSLFTRGLLVGSQRSVRFRGYCLQFPPGTERILSLLLSITSCRTVAGAFLSTVSIMVPDLYVRQGHRLLEHLEFMISLTSYTIDWCWLKVKPAV